VAVSTGKTELLKITFLYTTESVYYSETHFLLTFISTVGLQLSSLCWGERTWKFMWHLRWRWKSHTYLFCGGKA